MVTTKSPKSKISLRFVNNCLSVVVALVASYIIAVPYLPQLSWWVKHDSPIQTILPKKNGAAAASAVETATDGDKLFIPAMDLEKQIWGGAKSNLSKGVWHVPTTSTPDKGGNTVFVGHRFTYKDPYGGVFYHLDKVAVGDPITVHWQGKVYKYRVSDVQVVTPDDVAIEANTTAPQLTIYTCTPLWSVTHRLVVIAKPLEARS